jgi:hypothetical protein
MRQTSTVVKRNRKTDDDSFLGWDAMIALIAALALAWGALICADFSSNRLPS